MDETNALYQTLNNVEEKFKFDIQSLMRFIFPSDLQHPLCKSVIKSILRNLMILIYTFSCWAFICIWALWASG